MLGLDPATLPHREKEHEGIWPEHLPAVEAYLAVESQWRTTASGRVVGLDYTAVRAGFELAGIEMTPDLWSDVQQIEKGACAALNGGDA